MGSLNINVGGLFHGLRAFILFSILYYYDNVLEWITMYYKYSHVKFRDTGVTDFAMFILNKLHVLVNINTKS